MKLVPEEVPNGLHSVPILDLVDPLKQHDGRPRPQRPGAAQQGHRDGVWARGIAAEQALLVVATLGKRYWLVVEQSWPVARCGSFD